jgi:2'-5' RNA ligase
MMRITWDRFLAEKLGDKHDYSCAMVRLPDPIAKKIMSWGKRKVPNEDVYEAEGREDDPHVTVLYGIHDANPLSTTRLLRTEPSFKAELGKVSLFTTDPKYDVLKIEIISPKLHMLHKLLKRKLENSWTYPEYRPHVTIAYVKKETCDHLEGNHDFRDTKFMVNEVVFSSSNGEKTEIYLGF